MAINRAASSKKLIGNQDKIDANEDGEISVLECSEYGRTIGDTTGLFSEYQYLQQRLVDNKTATRKPLSKPSYSDPRGQHQDYNESYADAVDGQFSVLREYHAN